MWAPNDKFFKDLGAHLTLYSKYSLTAPFSVKTASKCALSSVCTLKRNHAAGGKRTKTYFWLEGLWRKYYTIVHVLLAKMRLWKPTNNNRDLIVRAEFCSTKGALFIGYPQHLPENIVMTVDLLPFLWILQYPTVPHHSTVDTVWFIAVVLPVVQHLPVSRRVEDRESFHQRCWHRKTELIWMRLI